MEGNEMDPKYQKSNSLCVVRRPLQPRGLGVLGQQKIWSFPALVGTGEAGILLG